MNAPVYQNHFLDSAHCSDGRPTSGPHFKCGRCSVGCRKLYLAHEDVWWCGGCVVKLKTPLAVPTPRPDRTPIERFR